MRKCLCILLILSLMIASVVSASAAVLPTIESTGLMDQLPQIPTMKTKNDGVTQTATFSDKVGSVYGVWNWTPVEAVFTDDSQTAVTLDLAGNNKKFKCQQGWADGVNPMPFAYDVTTADGVNVKYDAKGAPVFSRSS